ncbi:class I SAM-dependent methyltransferase [uncultured Draconibacterium sp.]|uniref:O-methyltransferase n=1 Tax=uncultured Draconibacterium sp. TaxID=1573823 RepID=UPI0025E2D08A|nr:class I SAM-dependent methyltransferase [uncultured Draconibacterium sp.]
MKCKSFLLILLGVLLAGVANAQYPAIENNLDKKVMAFLQENASEWRDMNVPLSDGRILYDIIIENSYTSALEIGTSTGHSAIWIAWALSKTGGKLTTIEIDKTRYLQAKANFKKAGVSKYIDLKLADAHELVPKLKEEFDFVFCDADKYWYKNYFVAIDPNLKVGGCYAAHNTAMRINGIGEFLRYIESLENYKTSIDKTSRSGISKSFKLK